MIYDHDHICIFLLYPELLASGPLDAWEASNHLGIWHRLYFLYGAFPNQVLLKTMMFMMTVIMVTLAMVKNDDNFRTMTMKMFSLSRVRSLGLGASSMAARVHHYLIIIIIITIILIIITILLIIIIRLGAFSARM